MYSPYLFVVVRKNESVLFIKSYMHVHSFILTKEVGKAQRFSKEESAIIIREQTANGRYKSDEISAESETAWMSKDPIIRVEDDEIKDGTLLGIKTTIVIQCETTDELLAHLSVIRRRIKKKRKKFPDNEFPDDVDIEFEDNNCYGVHSVKIEPDIA